MSFYPTNNPYYSSSTIPTSYPQQPLPLPDSGQSTVSSLGIHVQESQEITQVKQIVHLLENNQETEAIALFRKLPETVQNHAFKKHWKCMGKPTPESQDSRLRSMAHPDFGRVSLLNQDPRCQASSQEKARTMKAVLAHTIATSILSQSYSQNVFFGANTTQSLTNTTQTAAFINTGTASQLQQIANSLNQNQEQQALILLNQLPTKVKNACYGKLWELAGKPTENHPDPKLRAMAHPEFGKVAFFNQEERCQVPASLKGQAISAVLSDFQQTEALAYQQVDQMLTNSWKAIDHNTHLKGLEKHKAKKQEIDNLVKRLLPLFSDEAHQTPQDFAGSSIKTLLASYLQKYPLLQPYLQKLSQSLYPTPAQASPTPSQHLSSPQSRVVVLEEEAPQQSFTNQAQRQVSDDIIVVKASQPGGFTQTQSSGTLEQQKAYNQQVLQQTLQCIRQGGYQSRFGWQQLNVSFAAQGLTPYTGPKMIPPAYRRYPDMKVGLYKQDCLEVAQIFVKAGSNPIVLDMANDKQFGGGYEHGARAQEEDCCRRSGLSVAVDPKWGIQQTQGLYPISEKLGQAGGIYVPYVPVFRAGSDAGYQFLDQPFYTAFAIIAARRNPPLENPNSDNPRLSSQDASLIRQKIQTILTMALEKGHDSVILGPLGCGAFGNPPKHVAEIMMDVITRDFSNCFKYVAIACIDDHNTGRSHNRQGNFEPFKEVVLKHNGLIMG